jgi:hypothetical protein
MEIEMEEMTDSAETARALMETAITVTAVITGVALAETVTAAITEAVLAVRITRTADLCQKAL